MTSNGAPSSAASRLPTPSLSTRALHADHPDHTTHPNYPVAPALSLSTTFRSPHPHSSDAALLESAMRGEASLDMQDPSFHFYSRYSSSTNIRAEKVLSQIMNAHALTYSSGLSASYAALTFYAPRVVAIRRGYHGVHVGLDVYSRGREVKVIDLDDDYPTAMEGIPPTSNGKGGLLVWVETPLNPSGEARDLAKYVSLARAVGAPVVADSTFAPPPLQDPFVQGADMVMHSGTKYFGGHSDLLCGVLAVKGKREWDGLWSDRTYLGSTLGSMESYLLLRSLRTLTVRVEKQSKTATELARWLHSLTLPEGPVEAEDEAWARGTVVGRTTHSSLQPRAREEGNKEDPSFDPSSQMPGGHAPTFAFRTANPAYATWIPHLTEYFTPATSLGGVESLLEHRVKSDAKEDPRIVRVSVGLEDVADLKADLRGAFAKVLQMEREGKLK